jgi:enamine deaminase RidA (YjgF/YER057c/UK114 family)
MWIERMQEIAKFAALVLAAVPLFGQAPFASAETARLVFHAAPTGKGPLPQQVSDAVKHLKTYGQIIKLRAFVTAGTDLETVSATVSKMFQAKSRPVLNLVVIGRLPDPSAQVLMEAVSVSKNIENPNGLAFISGQLTQAPLDSGQAKIPVAPLAEKSIANLKAAAGSLEVNPADVVRVNCFTSSVEDHTGLESLVNGAFPKASVSVMQIERTPANRFVECEAVARLHARPADPVRLVNPTQAAFAQAAVVTAPRVIFTATYLASSNDDAGVRQALSDLKRGLDTAGSSLERAFYIYAYPGNAALLEKYRGLRFEFLDRTHAPASTNLVFEGAGATGSPLGIDAIAVPLR